MYLNSSFWRSSTRNQYLSIFTINILSTSHGCVLGWVSPVMSYLKTSDTHLTGGPISSQQASWIGSLLSVGAIITLLTIGFVTDYFGKRKTLIFLLFPNLITWILIYFSQNIYYLYAARLIGGLTAGGLLRIVPIITGEIAESHVRGILGTYFALCFYFGNLIMFILSTYLPFHIPPLIIMWFPILFFILMIFLPETPHHFLRCNDDENAMKSWIFYRNIDVTNSFKIEEAKIELENLKKSVQSSAKSEVELKDFYAKSSRRGLSMSFFLTSIVGFSGNVAILTYTADIFTSSGSSLSPNESAIIVAAIQLFGTYISSLTVDRFGRKILMTISCIGTMTFHIILATYSILIEQEIIDNYVAINWIPVFSLSMAVFLMSIGIASLPFMMITELVPTKIREKSMMIFMTVLISFSFVNLKIFPPMLELINLSGCLWFYASVCLFGALISIFILPETRGKNLFQSQS